MHAPLISTPMIRIGFKKTAIASLLALSTVTGLLTGCQKPTEAEDVQVSAKVAKAQQDLKTAYDKLAFYRRARVYFDGAASAKDPAAPKQSDDFYGATDARGKEVAGSVHKKDLDGLEQKAMKDLATAVTLYQDTVKSTLASDSVKANANVAAGNAETLLADIVLAKIDAQQAKFERVVGRINALASKVQANNSMIKGLTAQDPKPSLADLDKKSNDAKTGTQGVWIPSDKDAAIPALATADKQIADQTAIVDAQKAKLADLEAKRAEALKQAGQFSVQSDAAKGKQALDLYTQSSNSRKTAGDLSIQIQDNEGKLAEAQRELSVAQAQKKQLEDALTQFAAQNKQVNDGWDVVKKRIDEITAKSKIVVEGDPLATPPATAPSGDAPITSLTSAGDHLEKVSQELDKLRTEAKEHLDKADGYYATVVKLNKGVADAYGKFLTNGDLRESPQRPAWQWMVEIHNDADPNLQRAILQQRFARLYADNFYYTNSLLTAENALVATLGTATVAVPKTLDPSKLQEQVDTAKAAATKAFTDAEKYLIDITGPAEKPATPSTDTGKALVQSANILKLFEQYGRYGFAKSANDPAADTFLSSAKNMLTTLMHDYPDIELPLPLPPEIAPLPSDKSGLPTTPAAPTTAPATQPTDTTAPPTTAPTTAPATPETPATPPATPAAPAPPAAPATPAPPATPETPAAPPATPATPAPATPTPPATPPATPPPAAPATPAPPAPPG